MMEAILILSGVFILTITVTALIVKKKPEKVVELIEDTVVPIQRSSLIFKPEPHAVEDSVRIERLEAAIVLIEQAFGWTLIPRDGEEPEVSVLQKEESGHIVVLPAIHIEELTKPTPTKPILPRFVGK
jgi:hypothetical protein